MSYKKALFIFLILIQISIIVYLSQKIYHLRKNILGKTTISPVNKEHISINPSKEYKYFYEPKPNSRQKLIKDWLPEEVIYTINDDSLNERFNYPIEKQKATYRIITLGDSFTFGQNVSTEHNWTELLEDDLNKNLSCKNIKKIEVINLGVYGYDIQYAVERFRLRGVKYKPDLVIWTFTDFERILEKTMPYILEHKEEAEELEKQGIFYQNWKEAREKLEKEIDKEGFNNYLKEQLEIFSKIYNKKLLIVALPNNQIYINTLKDFVAKKNNIYFFQSSINWDQKEYFFPDMHFNKLGNHKMKEEIYNFIKRIIPCQQ